MTVSVSNSKLPALLLAVVQPSPFCNIDCKYCYLPERSATHRMSEQTLEKMAQFFFAPDARLASNFTVLWHGGEPTAVPTSFYEYAFATLKSHSPPGIHVQNRFSTNATLIDQSWCDLIKHWDVTIRVSVDGPKAIHDGNRVDRRGKGTFDHVMRGIKLLQKNDIPFDVITTISRGSLDYAHELWRFYRDIGVQGLYFCIEEVLGAHQINSLQPDDSYLRLQKFFTTLLELRNAEAPALYIRELDELIQGIPLVQNHFTRDESIPLKIVSIAWDGGISTFSPELLIARDIRHGDFIFGNVATHSLSDVWNSYKMRTIYKEIREGIRACEASCSHFKICGGGNPAAKLFETGTFVSTETLSCRLRIKAVGDVVSHHLASQPQNI